MKKWELCKEPSDYYYSSALFYEKGINNFKLVKHIGRLFDIDKLWFVEYEAQGFSSITVAN